MGTGEGKGATQPEGQKYKVRSIFQEKQDRSKSRSRSTSKSKSRSRIRSRMVERSKEEKEELLSLVTMEGSPRKRVSVSSVVSHLEEEGMVEVPSPRYGWCE